jgi:uncharacterized iron-regulated membrane protein
LGLVRNDLCLVTASIATDHEVDAASKRWRALWRTHFYAGVFAFPFLVLMAITGLAILYTQPLQDALQGDIRRVESVRQPVSLDQQLTAVTDTYPDGKVTSVNVPRNATTATSFGLEDGTEVFVDPGTASVLGTTKSGGGFIGLTNRLHGDLNNSAIKVSLPAVSATFDNGPVWRKYVLGDALLEIMAGWTLVLVASGVYLWWPRRSRVNDKRSRRNKLVPRLAKTGRARWRDLHAIPGLALSVILGFFVVSGMPWSGYWGSNFTATANEISPNKWVDAPNSATPKLGDLDRFGNQINWNTGNAAIPLTVTPIDPKQARPLNLDSIKRIAQQEGMLPGYSMSFPEKADGTVTLSNSWPRKTGEARNVYLDRYTGKKIDSMTANGYGSVSRATDTLVSTHMGTQLGLISRIVMTLGCLLVIWSSISALVMFAKRRRPGTAGLPRRPRDISMANRLIAIACVLGIAYPLWGVSAAIVVGIDRFLIRRTPRLRVAFGQR